MKLISHRGNINGPNPAEENSPHNIELALSKGYDVEIDLRSIDNKLFLGHDGPQYLIDISFLKKENLWIHCKNIEALKFCKDERITNNYFWHQNDDVTITSNNFFWTYPGKTLTNHSIAVMPEIENFSDIDSCYGICSDYVESYFYRLKTFKK